MIPFEPRRVRPGNPSQTAIAVDPVVLVRIGEVSGSQIMEDTLDGIHLFRKQQQVPHCLTAHLVEGITGGLFTSPVEADDPPLAVEQDDQRTDGVQKGVCELG
jgi:hypothetical protein